MSIKHWQNFVMSIVMSIYFNDKLAMSISFSTNKQPFRTKNQEKKPKNLLKIQIMLFVLEFSQLFCFFSVKFGKHYGFMTRKIWKICWLNIEYAHGMLMNDFPWANEHSWANEHEQWAEYSCVPYGHRHLSLEQVNHNLTISQFSWTFSILKHKQLLLNRIQQVVNFSQNKHFWICLYQLGQPLQKL